jgi:hypothetical protein
MIYRKGNEKPSRKMCTMQYNRMYSLFNPSSSPTNLEYWAMVNISGGTYINASN